jgi:hypothetical protein
LWRDGLGTIYEPQDYNIWRAHFGEPIQAAAAGTTVPEPTSWISLAVATIVIYLSSCTMR